MQEDTGRKTMYKIITIMIVVILVSGGTLMYLTKPAPTAEIIPAVTTDEPFSTLTCSGPGAEAALADVMEAYEQSGDTDAFHAAQSHIDTGTCEYNTDNVYWINAEYAGDFPELQAYVDVPCQPLANGHCLAIQPVYSTDETDENIVWSGYMLVEPRVDSGTTPTTTTITRMQKGLVLDLNY